MTIGNNNKRSLIPVQQKWEEAGDSVEGTLLTMELTVYRDNTRGRYMIQTAGGLIVFMGGYQIDQAMQLVSIGDKIGITYTGESEGSGGNKMKVFDIWIDDGVEVPETNKEQAERVNREVIEERKEPAQAKK